MGELLLLPFLGLLDLRFFYEAKMGEKNYFSANVLFLYVFLNYSNNNLKKLCV